MIKLRDVNGCFGAIRYYNEEVDHAEGMLSALQEDCGLCEYLSEQPGGAGVIWKHDNDVNKYEEILETLSLGSVFGAMYDNGTTEDRANLELFTNFISKQFDYASVCRAHLFPSTVFKIIDTLIKENSIIANDSLDKNNMKVLFLLGSYIDRNLIDYDYDTEEFLYPVDIEAEIAKCSHYHSKKESLLDLLSWFLLRIKKH